MNALRAFLTGCGWLDAEGPVQAREGCEPTFSAAALPEVRRADLFAEPDQRFGRLDAYTRAGLAAATMALRDAHLADWSARRPMGLVCSTVYGCLGTDLDYFDTAREQDGLLASPNLFAYTLPSCLLGETAIRFGLTGPAAVLQTMAADLAAVRQALELLCDGTCDAVLAGWCDLGRPEGVSGPSVPAGAAFFTLEREPRGETAVEIACRGDGIICRETLCDTPARLARTFSRIRRDETNRRHPAP